MKSYQELSVGLHSSLSLFVFQQTMIGCWVRSDDCNRRGKSRRNAVQPLCLSYSLILLTLSLWCVRQDKQAGHSCLIRHQPTAAFPGRESHKQILTWRTKITIPAGPPWWYAFTLSERLFLFTFTFSGASVEEFIDLMECVRTLSQ